MSKRVANRYSKNKQGYIKGGFVAMRCDVIDSPALADLSGNAVKAFLIIKRAFNGKNNGEIVMSCRMLSAKTNMSRATASRALVELQIHGLIRMTRPGLYTGHTATTWELTETRNTMSISEEKDLWRRWRPGVDCRTLDSDYCGLAPLEANQNKVSPEQQCCNDVNPSGGGLVADGGQCVSQV